MGLQRLAQSLVADAGMFVSTALDRRRVVDTLALLRPMLDPDRLVRVGGMGDGGYLLPDLLDDVTTCFSPGVDRSVSFERDLAAIGIRSHLIDAAIHELPGPVEGATFAPLFLSSRTGPTTVRLDDWVESQAPSGDRDLMLQMDIEGAEYEVIASASDGVLSRFRIVIIEFHHLHHVLDHLGHRIIDGAVRRLADMFCVAHLHVNNTLPPVSYRGLRIPPLVEVTFVRTDDVPSEWRAHPEDFPHRLDRPCDASKPESTFEPHWFDW